MELRVTHGTLYDGRNYFGPDEIVEIRDEKLAHELIAQGRAARVDTVRSSEPPAVAPRPPREAGETRPERPVRKDRSK